MSQRTSAAKNKTVIFNASEVADHLASLKAAVGDQEGVEWWRPTLQFDWASLRKGNNNTQWLNTSYRDQHGISGRLVVRINGERHTGQIMPTTDAGVAELTALIKNPNVKVEKRTKKPAIQIQKWRCQVKTAEDGITPLYDGAGNPIVPGDEFLSPYFRLAALIDEAFTTEAKARVAAGAQLVAAAVEAKKKDKAVTAQAVVDAFNATRARQQGDMVLSQEQMSGLRKLFPQGAEPFAKGAILASNTKVVNLVQMYISDTAKKNAGMALPNPMTRASMDFDTTTGLAKMSFYDKSQPYMENGRQKFDVAKVDGDPVTADNVHKFIRSRSVLDGIINLDSVCFSSMGISMPVKPEVLVVDPPSSKEMSIDDVYEFDDVNSGTAAAAAAGSFAPATSATSTTSTTSTTSLPHKQAQASTAPASPPPAKSTAAASSAPGDDATNFDYLLNELQNASLTGKK